MEDILSEFDFSYFNLFQIISYDVCHLYINIQIFIKIPVFQLFIFGSKFYYQLKIQEESK